MKISTLFFLFITILTFLYVEHIKVEMIYALTNSSNSLQIKLMSINGSSYQMANLSSFQSLSKI